MPRYMNCNHSDDGWCLACVNELHERLERLEAQDAAKLHALKSLQMLFQNARPYAGGICGQTVGQEQYRLIYRGCDLDPLQDALADVRQSQAVGVEIAIQLRDALLRFDIDYDLTEGEEANIVLTKEDQDTLRAAVLALENLNATPNDSGKEGGGE